MLTGHVPFERPSGQAKLWAQLSADAPLPSARRPELPPACDAVVQRAMAKDPARALPVRRRPRPRGARRGGRRQQEAKRADGRAGRRRAGGRTRIAHRRPAADAVVAAPLAARCSPADRLRRRRDGACRDRRDQLPTSGRAAGTALPPAPRPIPLNRLRRRRAMVHASDRRSGASRSGPEASPWRPAISGSSATTAPWSPGSTGRLGSGTATSRSSAVAPPTSPRTRT